MLPLALDARLADAMDALGSWARPQAADDEFLALGARDAVLRIRRGEIKAEAYAARLLAEYAAHRYLNVATTIDGERVLAGARAVDRARARGARLGAAAGLPFAAKDQIAIAGYPASGGNAALRGYVPRHSAAVVERLVAAGAIPFCKTTLPDMVVVDGLMHQASSHSDAFGPVRNPYDPTRIPGGSSGGSAAIVAARIVPAALGLDTNGSVRCPSALCGVVGFRPSTYTIENAINHANRKRYSDEGLVIPPARRLDTIGPIARTVADVAFLDTLITGETVRPITLRRTRIGVPRSDYWEQDEVDPDVARVIQDALTRLREAGATLVEIDFDAELRGIVGTLVKPTPAGIFSGDGLEAPVPSRATIAEWLEVHAPGVTVEQVYAGRPVREGRRSFPPVEEQVRVLTEAAHRYSEIYRSHGVVALAYPTVPTVATPIRAGGPREPLGESIIIRGKPIEEGRVIAANIFIAPRMGAAGLNVPAGLARGLPVGLELDAEPGRDTSLLALGVAVQEAIGRIPPPTFP
jgi:mandelamide amidase